MEFAFRTNTDTINELTDLISKTEVDEIITKRAKFKKKIKNLIIPDSGIIKADTLKNSYFPSNQMDGSSYDVFISHSHKNQTQAYLLAAWLEKNKGLSCFVDSFAWASADQLLKELDDKYCVKVKNKKDNTYYYSRRNFTTTHVHAILSMALLETIQRSTFCIFLESSESVPLQSKMKKESLSPWLYEEIKFMQLLQPKAETKLFENIQKAFCCRVSYDVSDILEFPFLDVEKLNMFPTSFELQQ